MLPSNPINANVSSAANPVAQFGNVYGGGARPNWTTLAILAAITALLGLILWRKHKP